MASLAQLLENSVKLPLFVMLRYDNGATRSREDLVDHLEWTIEAEERGEIFLSGPVEPNAKGLFGLTILRASTLSQAEQIASADPFARRQLMRHVIHSWTAVEGRIDLSVRLSQGSYALHAEQP